MVFQKSKAIDSSEMTSGTGTILEEVSRSSFLHAQKLRPPQTTLLYILGKKSNGPPAINFPHSRTAGRIFIIYTSF